MQVERRELTAPESDGLKKQTSRGGREVPEDGPASPGGAQQAWGSESPPPPPPPSAYILANRYILLDPPEGCPLHTCIDIATEKEMVCRVVGRDYTGLVSAHLRLDGHPRINPLLEVVLGGEYMYLMFPGSAGDLHCHVRQRKRLRESEARRLFKQVAEAVAACHEQGVVLRDLKLRKFVFSDASRTELKLESLEDAVVLEEGDDDELRDKRGCPAYVSPEILRSHARYSGRAADMWSLGVILYTMLVGRYPFNDTEHSNLFVKISRGHFLIPEGLSSRAKCLIRSLLRRDPTERLTAQDVLIHPWLTQEEKVCVNTASDQVVPLL